MALQNLRSNTANKRPTASGMVDGQVAINTNATNPGLFFKDAGDGIRKVGPVFIGSSAPNSSPATGGSSGHSIGEQWLDTSGGRYVLKIWDGTAWRDDDSNYLQLTGGALSGALTIDNAANLAALDLKFDGDTDTGFYAPAANTLGFVGGGTERLRIDSSGNVGLNNTSPSSYLAGSRNLVIGAGASAAGLTVRSSTSTDGFFAFADGTTGNETYRGFIAYGHSTDSLRFATSATERLRIDSSGRVGIGTSSPDDVLDVRSGAAGFAQFVHSSGMGGIRISGSAASSAANLVFSNDHTNGVSDEYTIQMSGDNDRLAFRSGGPADTERVSFMADGKVGIGTSSPLEKLEVQNGHISVGSSTNTTSTNTLVAGYGYIIGSTKYGNVSIRSSYVNTTNAASLEFYTAAPAVSERMRIDSSGKVGIGTTSPGAALHIESSGADAAKLRVGFDSTRYYDIFRKSSDGFGLLNFYGSQSGFTGYVFGGVDGERMRIDSSGNIKIQTNNVNLQGAGTFRINSGSTAGSLNLDGGATNHGGEINLNGGSNGGTIQFRTGEGSGQQSEKARIDSSGRVGIGTSSPLSGANLTVAGNSLAVTGQNTAHSANSIRIGEEGSGLAEIRYYGPNSSTNGSLRLRSSRSDGSNNQDITIDSSGRVGINITTFSDAATALAIKNGASGSEHTYLDIVCDTNETTRVRFSEDGSTFPGEIRYNTFGHDMTFHANSAERMRIDSSGRVGIGTSSPDSLIHIASSTGPVLRLENTDTTLNTGNILGKIEFESKDVSNNAAGITANMHAEAIGSAGATDLVFGAGTAVSNSERYRIRFDGQHIWGGATERMRIDSSGRLLVGTSSARGDFYNGTTVHPLLQLEKASGSAGQQPRLIIVHNSSTGEAPELLFAKTRGTANGSTTIVNSGDELGLISFQGADGSGNVEGARIQAFVDNTPGSNDMPGRLVFSTTADGASSPTERVRITQQGATIFSAGSASGSGGSSLINNNDAGFVNDAGFGQTLHLGNTYGGAKGYIIFLYNGVSIGSVTAGGAGGSATTSVNYNTTSDYRLKENVVNITNGITRVKQLQPKRFNFIANAETTVDGFLAHEAQTVVPEAVTGTHNEVDDDGNAVMQGIDQSKLVPLLTAALQEAITKIETLETKVAALEGS